MANTKIQRVKVSGTTYDIDLPSDATPSISSLTVNGTVTASTVSTKYTSGSTVQTVNINPILGVSYNTGSTTYLQSFPLKSGTFAMTSDITDTKNTVGNSAYSGTIYLVGVQSYSTSSSSSAQSYVTSNLYMNGTTLTVNSAIQTGTLNASSSVTSPLYNIGGTNQYMKYNSVTGCVEIVC